MRYQSITTPSVKHDAANAITELIILNNDFLMGEYPWKVGRPNHKKWTRIVGIIKKLMMPSYGLTADQLAFYVHRCRPMDIDSKEFAKMAVVAKKLLLKMDLGQLMDTYRRRRTQMLPSMSEKIHTVKSVTGPKNLVELIEELEWLNAK